jgi:hypothetical protein
MYLDFSPFLFLLENHMCGHWEYSSVLECLPCIHVALGSVSSAEKKVGKDLLKLLTVRG